ncbi:hypothetical protein [Streptomyces sp. 061-3]|uniref:hypothetical protein n=1 Tax=Streptomyces sp. 061-3 TaxID=2789268 RepID=UPI00397FC2F1
MTGSPWGSRGPSCRDRALRSAPGNNNVVLNNARADVATINDPGSVAPDVGWLLSRYWHSAAQ